MADKRKTKKRKEEYGEPPESEKPTREEYSVAKWLKANVPTKKTKFLNHHVEYFTGVKAVDALLTSKWATGKNPIFTTRLEVTDYLHQMLLHKLFHRAKKVPVSEQELKGKSKKKDVDKNSKSGDEKDEKSQVSASEGKDTKDGKEKDNKDKEKKKRKIRLEMHMEQLFLDTLDAYVWIYDPMPWYYWVCGALVVFGTIGVCMFPLWPATVRKGVYYLSIAAAAFLVLIIALAVLRVVVFCLVWLLTLARHHLWLLPNLTEDVGFFASFWPLYKYEYRGPGSESDKSSKKKKRKKDKQSDDEEDKAPLLVPAQEPPGGAAGDEAGDNKSYKRKQRGPCMTLIFALKNKFQGPPVNEIGQGQFNIDDLVDIRLQFDQKTPSIDENEDSEIIDPDIAPLPVFINISVKKTEQGKDLTVKLKVTCASMSKQLTCTDTWTDWIPLREDQCKYEEPYYALDNLELTFAVCKYGTVTFADLYDDTDIIDFKLTLQDGNVSVHKACLAAHSNKFKTMFTSVWKDVTDGRIEVKGVTPHTLSYLKDYMYLGKLPDVDIRPMLLFAMHYSMQNLKADCITKLVETVEFYSLYDLLEFACENNIPELTFALMVRSSDEIVHNAYELKKNPPLEKETQINNSN